MAGDALMRKLWQEEMPVSSARERAGNEQTPATITNRE